MAKLSKEAMESVSYISNETILKDIEDTKEEVANLQMEYDGYNLIAKAKKGTIHARIPRLKADVAWDGIYKRKVFIAKLEKILEERNSKKE